MQLSYISITNFRSITDAYKLDLSNLTVLLGKNNRGKTNIIKAINLGMEILKNMELLHKRKHIVKQLYEWHDDFPISLQNSKKLKQKQTEIRLDFTLTEKETIEFQKETSSLINGNLSIYIKIDEDNTLHVSIPKKGKNASAMTNKIVTISKFICDRFNVQYIPAVRSESDAYDSILALVEDELAAIDDEEYKKALIYIEAIQKKSLENLSTKVITPLQTFLPQIKTIDLYMVQNYRLNNRVMNRRRINIDIDDGVRTSLSNKGDGVKSLVTIAMLSQLSSKGQKLIIVDEPENHLHPEAVHYIDQVLHDLSKNNQVLISSHNPIFVNRNILSSNLIVESGKVKKAEKIEEIRDILGVICSDNLMYSDYVVVVEGRSDKEILYKFFMEDEQLRTSINNKSLVIRDIGGTHNLKSEVYALRQYCCNFLIVLDYDKAGKEATNELKTKFSIEESKIRYLIKENKKDTEIEDFIKPEIYSEYLLSYGIDVSDPIFKNVSLKWSDRIDKIATKAGIEFTKELENEFKKEISTNLLLTPMNESLDDNGCILLQNIAQKVKMDLKSMQLLLN